MVAGAAAQKLQTEITKEQEILINISNMIIETYVAESTLLRVEKLTSLKGAEASKVQMAMMKTYLYDAADRINKEGKDAINGFSEGDEQRMMLMGLKRFTKSSNENTKEYRRIVAAALLNENKYCF